MLEKRFGSFALWRVTKFENVSQRHRTEKSVWRERQKTASDEHRTNAERVSVTNFVVCDHAPNFLYIKLTAIQNRFAFITVRALLAWSNWTCQKEIAALVRKARRREIAA